MPSAFRHCHTDQWPIPHLWATACSLSRRAAHNGDLRFEGRAVGDAVEPLAEPFGLSQAARLLDEYEERGLEGVFGVLVVAEDAPADAEDHRSVPPHQRGERGGIARGDEPLQQVRVGRVAGHGRLPEEMDDGAELCASHAADPSCREFLAPYRYTAGWRAGDSHSGLIGRQTVSVVDAARSASLSISGLSRADFRWAHRPKECTLPLSFLAPWPAAWGNSGTLRDGSGDCG
jgi:hypothetical protein